MAEKRDQTAGRGFDRQPHKAPEPQPQPARAEEIQVFRRCPICWDLAGGHGVAYSTQGQTRYYKCCRTKSPEHPPCGHTWSVRVALNVVTLEHKVVSLDGLR
jgi:hypothetical protein